MLHFIKLYINLYTHLSKVNVLLCEKKDIHFENNKSIKMSIIDYIHIKQIQLKAYRYTYVLNFYSQINFDIKS